MGDINKLPKWAQQEIETLKMRVAEGVRRADANLRLAGFQEGQYGTMVAPQEKWIYFNEDDIDGLSVQYERGVLTVSSGGNALSVRPQASNVVRITQWS